MQGYRVTEYFRNEILRKRAYLRIEWCIEVIKDPVMTEVQPDGRIRYWGYVPELRGRALRVVTLSDGKTIHNAFLDRDFLPRGEVENHET